HAVRTTHRNESGDPMATRRCRDRHPRGPADGLRRGVARRSWRASHRPCVEGEAVRHGGPRTDRRRRGADPRRHGIHERALDRARLPGRTYLPDLRGHERDPTAGHCAGAPCGHLAPFLGSVLDNPMNTVDKSPPGAVSVDKPPVPRASIADVWRVPIVVWRARKALDRGELEAARVLVAPLLGTFGTVTFVRKLAAEILYASGDPLSAAALFEQAAKRLPNDRAVVVGLVASYAALNRAGDARRSAGLLPEHVDVRLALAWAELVALGGERARGAAIVEAIATDPELSRSAE